MSNTQMISLHLTPLFSTLNKPKQEAWRTYKAHKKKTAPILLPFSKFSCGYVRTLSFFLAWLWKKKNQTNPGEIYFPLLGGWKSWQNCDWASVILSISSQLLQDSGLCTPIPCVLLSMPNMPAKDKTRAGIAWTTALTSSLGSVSPKSINRVAQVF